MFNKVSKLDKPLPDIAAHTAKATQPKTPQTLCKLWILPAWCNLPTSCIKPVDFIKLHQVCEQCMNIRLAATWYLQTCWPTSFPGILSALLDLLQVDETTCIKPACSSQLAASLSKTCNRLVIIKPEQAMRTHPDIATCAFLVVQGSHEVKQGFSANVVWPYKWVNMYRKTVFLTFKSCATSSIRDKSSGSPFIYQSAIAWITRCRMEGDDWPWK